jgi:pyruvate kinase
MTQKPLKNRRTKIVATLGPASSNAKVISDLISSGVNVFRLNFSHGSQDQHRETASIVRKIAEEQNKHIGILGDLQGPKIRIGELQTPEKELEQDKSIILTTDKDSADSENDRIHVAYTPLPNSVSSGDTLLLDDGLIRLTVSSVDGNDVNCIVSQSGILKSRKGLNRLGGGLSADAITEKDLSDLQVIIDLDLEYVAVSFPACGSDLDPVKDALASAKSNAKIIAKIERAEVVANEDNIKELINAADGVMVARGDLGVEIGDSELISIQKRIIRLCRQANKTVITATQMMESMINNPVPTRAEVFDVANAVLDGTDAVMLSAETATGKFPSKVVKAMAETALGAEKHPMMRQSSYRVERMFSEIDESIAMSAMYAANHVTGVAAIICLTESGITPLLTSRLSSTLPIFGVSPLISTCRRMSLYRGVIPIHYDVMKGKDDLFEKALSLIVERGAITKGQRVAITSGDLYGKGGSTNTLKILEY